MECRQTGVERLFTSEFLKKNSEQGVQKWQNGLFNTYLTKKIAAVTKTDKNKARDEIYKSITIECPTGGRSGGQIKKKCENMVKMRKWKLQSNLSKSMKGTGNYGIN